MYFKFTELIRTDTGLPNIPVEMEHIENLVFLADFLDEIRQEYGAPIVVNSAYRTNDVNKAVRGVPKSLHLYGRAADIRPCSSNTYQQNLDKLISVISAYNDRLSEFIIYPTFVHIAI